MNETQSGRAGRDSFSWYFDFLLKVPTSKAQKPASLPPALRFCVYVYSLFVMQSRWKWVCVIDTPSCDRGRTVWALDA